MSATLISRNPDLARLEAEGFRLRVVQATAHHLLIDAIPAVNSKREVVTGTLYCPLEIDQNDDVIRPIPSHQCWWIGEAPCDATGRLMTEMISNPQPEPKGDGFTTTVGFSRKRVNKTPYDDLHEKIWAYVEMIWHEARVIDPGCDPRCDKPVPAVVEAQKRVFHYPDMATTRAGIGVATAKLLLNRVAVIGVGGTGSYILDLLAKTPINEIHIFDGSKFELHNAFRAPGAPRKEELTDPFKVDWFGDIYDRMRSGIVRHPYHVRAEQLPELAGFDFVFVSIDDAEARKVILEGLIALSVPFIDVGIDIALDKVGCLRGMCRFTVGTANANRHIYEVVSFAAMPENDVYRNIQVADLNMQNASMAVIKWKKLMGFYADDMREHHSLYTVATHSLTKDDRL
jgi:ThiF family